MIFKESETVELKAAYVDGIKKFGFCKYARRNNLYRR